MLMVKLMTIEVMSRMHDGREGASRVSKIAIVFKSSCQLTSLMMLVVSCQDNVIDFVRESSASISV